ncbi:MAG: transcription elongation factor GreA [Parcubacteria group bacterium Gr01-1014_30]|nr:MAG: transcription elongation factor GreA [Parcubacteria group bacterium Gr01-1014_30]
MTDEKIFYLTKKGLEKVRREYAELRKLRLAKTKGDVPRILQSEDVNPEYLSFQEDLGFLEIRIAELENILKNTRMIKIPPKEKREAVNLGATVTLEEQDGKVNEFMIVGTLEANPIQGKISSESPVGKELLGKLVGDQVTISSPVKVVYKIKKIKYQLS